MKRLLLAVIILLGVGYAGLWYYPPAREFAEQEFSARLGRAISLAAYMPEALAAIFTKSDAPKGQGGWQVRRPLWPTAGTSVRGDGGAA